MEIILAFTVGISLGAVLSWGDDGFKPSYMGYAWLTTLILSSIFLVVQIVKNLNS